MRAISLTDTKLSGRFAMKLISCHDGKLHALEAGDDGLAGPADGVFRTGLPALDALPPGGAFARGAVHELLAAPADGRPLFLAALMARGAAGIDTEKGTRGEKVKAGIGGQGSDGARIPPAPLPPCSPARAGALPTRAIIWSDPRGEIYPPALAALGIPLERLF